MRDAVEWLATEQPPDQAHGFEMISDLVWQVTLVGATLVRYHYRAYEAALTAQGPVGRQAAAGTLAGCGSYASTSDSSTVRAASRLRSSVPSAGPWVFGVAAVLLALLLLCRWSRVRLPPTVHQMSRR